MFWGTHAATMLWSQSPFSSPFLTPRPSTLSPLCIPEQPGRRKRAAPALSLKLRREAPAEAIDPVIALGKPLLLPKEGG